MPPPRDRHGELISKTAEAAHTATVCPRYIALLARARAWRRGDAAAAFGVADGRAACDVVGAVVDRARQA
jgi:hypothetical protein